MLSAKEMHNAVFKKEKLYYTKMSAAVYFVFKSMQMFMS